jgi:hypothetical protein
MSSDRDALDAGPDASALPGRVKSPSAAERGCGTAAKEVDRHPSGIEHVYVRTRRVSLLVAGLLGLALAAPAQANPGYLRFEVLSVKGEQTATWSGTREGLDGCGTVARSGSQTISFESLGSARLSLQRLPRTNPRTGKRRGFTYFGRDVVPTNWTFSRIFQESMPASCPPPEGTQASDCGTQGPFPVPVSVGWRGGAVEFRGVLSREFGRSPNYESCEYEAYHALTLIDSKGRLSQRRLTRRGRRTIRVEVSGRMNDPAVEGDGSQTTTLAATVTLRRVR